MVTLGEGGVLVARRGSHKEPLPLHNDDEGGGKLITFLDFEPPLDNSVTSSERRVLVGI